MVLLRDTDRLGESVKVGQKALEIVLAVEPVNEVVAWEVRLDLARSLRRADRKREVVNFLEPPLTSYEKTFRAKLSLAEKDFPKRQDSEKFIFLFDVYEVLGKSYLDLGDLEKARLTFERGRFHSKKPSSETVSFGLLDFNFSLGNWTYGCIAIKRPDSTSNQLTGRC